ncbi:conserved hypothetical protein [Methylocella silvestris BL2]|uniref:Alkaline proteinase inhibitor/ Outer membrane lipoprotein Omp19 domain-containing protein n=1 Tax=Methylocella silvestris (strain DSM 15510 / CIP 108128 / LMG 27833 / NCIMB 13906 / BL2) TaxID=395965 RepID=B8ENL7_METSB|nr:protease inhibitor Inh/omp19 family protein [Methylocella silvestris]ACK50803.1 conserved hypothetical protein [Methylocella silvestris BL2]
MRLHLAPPATARSVRSTATKILLTIALCVASGERLGAATLDNPDAVLGQWDLTLEGSNKACRLTFRAERVRGGFYLGMPAGCRRGLAPLANAAAWSLPGGEHLIIGDVVGAPILDFALQPDGALAAISPAGENYKLAFAAAAPAPPAAAENPAAPPRAVATKLALRPADIAGRYAVLRDGGRDTGCMVTLDASTKAFLAPACRDQGIVTFDPVGWRLAGSRLVLVARKGHTTQLDLQPDGTFVKDAALGKNLGLKKL